MQHHNARAAATAPQAHPSCLRCHAPRTDETFYPTPHRPYTLYCRACFAAMNRARKQRTIAHLDPALVHGEEALTGDNYSAAERVTEGVCTVYALRKNDLFGPSRETEVTEARHLLWYLLAREVRLGLAVIANYTGHHRSTVYAGMARIAEMFDREGESFLGCPLRQMDRAVSLWLKKARASDK